MKYLLSACFILLMCVFSTHAQNKNALIIGIDNYTPPPGYNPPATEVLRNIPNLAGCKNDALSIVSLIRSKFEFHEENIDTLFDQEATRVNFLSGIKKLLDKSTRGDVAFIYYAGHGSQVYNSMSKESDKKDETIVPSDAWKEGVSDIRDKESF
jgi:Caspase domain